MFAAALVAVEVVTTLQHDPAQLALGEVVAAVLAPDTEGKVLGLGLLLLTGVLALAGVDDGICVS